MSNPARLGARSAATACPDYDSLLVEGPFGAEALEALIPEWEVLDAALSPRTPFSSPLWNCLWWRHLSRRNGLIRDRPFIHVMREQCGELVGVAPLMLTHRPGHGPLRLRELQFFGADRNLTEIRGIICRPERQEQALRTLAAALTAPSEPWDWLRWGRVPSDSAWTQRLADSGALATSRDIVGCVVDLPADWSVFRAGLPRNIKESLRKCYNSLKRDRYEFRLRVIELSAELAPALDRFFALHRARANAAFGVSHPDVFIAPATQRFLRDYVRQMAGRGQLRLFELEIEGIVRASRIGFIFGEELYLYYSGFDPAWAKYSVMTTTVAEVIRWAIGQGLKSVNLSTGKDVSKTRWRPREVVYREIVQVAPTWRARPAFQLFAAAQRILSG